MTPRHSHTTPTQPASVVPDHPGVAALTDQLKAAQSESLHLHRALTNSREIGAAVGILMERHSLTYDAAFDLLRQASQQRNERLATVASTLVTTGEIDSSAQPGRSWGVSRRAPSKATTDASPGDAWHSPSATN